MQFFCLVLDYRGAFDCDKVYAVYSDRNVFKSREKVGNVIAYISKPCKLDSNAYTSDNCESNHYCQRKRSHIKVNMMFNNKTILKVWTGV